MSKLYKKILTIFYANHSQFFGLMIMVFGLIAAIASIVITIIILFEPETQTPIDGVATILAGALFLLFGTVFIYFGRLIMKREN